MAKSFLKCLAVQAQPQTLADTEKRVFVDAAAMKQKVRENLTKHKVVVSDYYKDWKVACSQPPSIMCPANTGLRQLLLYCQLAGYVGMAMVA